MCNVVLHVHVKQYEMYMWDSTTCASRTVLDVHLKQDRAPGKGTFLAEKDSYSELTKVSSPDIPPYAGSKGFCR